MTDVVEHLFMYFLAISLVKYCLNYLSMFLIEMFDIEYYDIYIYMYISVIDQEYALKVFSPSIGWSFHFVNGILWSVNQDLHFYGFYF